MRRPTFGTLIPHVKYCKQNPLVRILEKVVVTYQHGKRLGRHTVEEGHCTSSRLVVGPVARSGIFNAVHASVRNCEVCARMPRPRDGDGCRHINAIAFGNSVVGRGECERPGVAVVNDPHRRRVVLANCQRRSGHAVVAHVGQRELERLVGILIEGIVVDWHHNNLLLNS